MKIAMLGGSFNPLHIGHALLAEIACREAGFDKVLFVPAFIPPHKSFTGAASADDRLGMVKAFCADEAHFEAEDCEISRGGVSYTFDTLQYIIKKYGASLSEKPALIMGQENAAEFDKWHNSQEILKIANIVVARRREDKSDVDTTAFQNKPTGTYTGGFDATDFDANGGGDACVFPYEHIELENPLLPFSSTEIRARIAERKAWRYLVPESVFRYIVNHKLYGYK